MHLDHDAATPAAPMIAFDDFLKVDIRAGTVIEATIHKGARKPSYKLVIDFGPVIGTRKSIGQVAALYACEDLVGKQVAAVVNFPARQIGSAMSQCLTLGFGDEEGRIALFSPDVRVPDGSRLA